MVPAKKEAEEKTTALGVPVVQALLSHPHPGRLRVREDITTGSLTTVKWTECSSTVREG